VLLFILFLFISAKQPDTCILAKQFIKTNCFLSVSVDVNPSAFIEHMKLYAFLNTLTVWVL